MSASPSPIALPDGGKVIALSGGIGGAKLALGLKHILPADSLTVIANTADDFEHMGLTISPDIDTINPGSFDVEQMVFVLTWAIVGGTGTFYGPILGCVALTIFNEIILRELGFEQMRPLIYGLLMILSVLFLPKGLESLVQAALRRRAGDGRTETASTMAERQA